MAINIGMMKHCFLDENGEPEMLSHECSKDMKGKPLEENELQLFGATLLKRYFKDSHVIIQEPKESNSNSTPNLIVQDQGQSQLALLVLPSIYEHSKDEFDRHSLSDLYLYLPFLEYCMDGNLNTGLALMNFACFGKELEFVMPYHGMDCVVSFEVLIESL